MKREAGALLSSIQLDRTSRKSISVQLYMGLRDILLSGWLKPGDRLPASRTMAREAGVSRTTVIDAVDRLISEGMLTARVGAGTYVSKNLVLQKPQSTPVSATAEAASQPRLSYTVSHASGAYAPRARLPHNSQAFISALPALDAFPLAQWARISARHLRGDREDVMGYGPPEGHPALRHAIATHLATARGITCKPEQVFVTSGAQQAFSLIGQLFLDAGDRVWFENPGAKGARNAFVATGAELIPIPVDEEGMRVVDAVEKAPHFRLAFVTPSHQQPLGHVMSLARRFELLEAAAEARALIVEDDYDGEFYFGTRPQPALKSIDTHGRVLYVGTFSKSLFPSLRLGFVMVPERMIDTFERVFSSWISGPPTATQATVSDFMDEGHFSTHIRMMRRLYKARYDALMSAAGTLPETIRLQETSSGFHTPAYLDDRVDEQALVEQARAKNVTVAPLSQYCLAPIARKGLVIGFGSTMPDDIKKGIDVIGSLPALKV
ncbi:MocR-like pyridoxine biosynthesis transcription factor PdxR [Roseobacter weihaiensis]|uniref:MocR-like pyridoxine biosynthesis transcription factor PdxR n=1 Tax=Roseobacter weihaiensis TaxID=2763262 RepID=UPI001D0B184B|nr:PLP-dependent aminotransferase family protein [Roseobacter sp. H9]